MFTTATSSTTLSAIGVTWLSGCCVLLICFVAFEIALRRQSTNIAPRCSARPRNTIHNGFAQEYLPDHAQHRCGGNWIKWVMTLDYKTLLTGVPGTGTRNDGLSGSLLHVTLDSIVLLRFHALGRKLTTLATILCIGLLLPLYVTTPQQQWLPIPNNNNEDCSRSSKITTTTIEGEGKSLLCSNITLVPYHHKNLYKKMTLGNVPNLYYFSQNQDYFKTTSSSASATSSTNNNNNNNDNDNDSNNIPPEDTFVFRLRASVLVVWLVTLYAFYLLQEEWVEIVKLRRIWYLQQRRGRIGRGKGGGSRCKQKIQEMMKKEEEKEKDVKDNNDEEIKNQQQQQQQELLLEKDWYEGLLLPSTSSTTSSSIQEQEQVSGNNNTAIMKEDDDDDVDEVQLKVVEEEEQQQEEEKHLYERHAWIPHPEQPDTVPNVEPYSILLGPLKLQQKQQQQQQQRHHHNDNDDDKATMPSSQLELFMKDMIHTLEKELPQEPGYTSPICAITVVPCAKGIGPVWRQWYATATKMRRLLLIRRRMKQLQRRRQQQQQQHYNENMTTPENTYLRQVFGILLDDQLMEQAQETLGPEQMGVYSRELAQAASNFCPYGCMEGQIYSASLVKLIELEQLQQEHVEDAKLELQRRQREFMFQQMSVQEESNNNNSNNEDEGRDDEEKCGLLMTKDSDHRSSSYELSPSSSSLSSVNRVQQSRKRIVSSSRSSISAVSIASDDNEDDAMEMMELTAQSSSAVATTTTTTSVMSTSPRSGNFGNLRIRQTRRRRFLLTLKKYSNQVKYQLFDLYQRYNTLAAWKDLIQNCSKAWSEEHTFVVITFTSRHAAAAARSVTKDLQDIPIPPLADAASCKLLPFRYFCRPVTVTVNNLQKACRLYTLLTFLALMCIFYTIPLTRAANRLDPDTIAYLFPEHEKISNSVGVSIPDLLSGLTSSIVWSLFFMLCPQVFKLMAYFGSNATSLAQAERRALQYFWWFMVITAFAGPMLAYWILGAVYYKDDTLNGGLRKMLLAIAGTTPTTIAATWINWIIYRFTIILPINFLLQFNTFLFSFLGWNCCARLTIGGGPGGPTPYRIFVDSGVVLMCVVALGPASPLVAPAALMYFFVCEPLLRRNVIFVYRQRYDDGGLRWTFVCDMIISALIVGQFLLSLQMILKTAYGSSFVSALAIPTTVWFQISCKKKYMPSFENTALLRTTLLDGWDNLDDMTMERREEHRRFLVDAHRAAYIPACIAGTESATILTNSPAMVVPHSIIDSPPTKQSQKVE